MRTSRLSARLGVIDADWPWTYASAEALPGFEE
jgi:hypothetical protein